MGKDTKFTFSQRMAAKHLTDKHQERINILRKLDKDKSLSVEDIESIAGLNINDVKSVSTMMNDTVMAVGKYTKDKSAPKYADDSAIGKKVYSNLYNSGYLNYFMGDTSNLVKTQSGKELMDKTVRSVVNNVNYNRTTRQGMQDFQQVYRGVHNLHDIIENGGQIVSYDLETLGGTNAYGHQQLDYITEFAAMVHDIDPVTKKMTINEDLSKATLVGFSDTEYTREKNYIEGLRGTRPVELTSKDNVYIHRLSLLSDPDFKYKQQTKNGFEFRVTNSNPDNIENSIDNALKGLEEYRNIGKKQEEWIRSQGFAGTLEEYKRQYTQEASDLIHKHVGLSDRAVSLAHNSFNFDDPMFGMSLGKTVEHLPGKSVDSYQLMKYQQEQLGIGAHLPAGFITTDAHGITTQDQLKNGFGLSGKVGAHNAEEDAKALVNILTHKIDNKSIYLDHLLGQTNTVNSKLNNLKNNSPIDGLTGRKPIFLMDKTGQKDWSMNKNGMSFAYNPNDKSIKTYDGFRIAENGKVSKENINGFGPKAGALYNHEYEEINLDGNWKKQFSQLGLSDEMSEQFYQQYSSLDKLYIMRSKEFRDPAKMAEKFGENSAIVDPNTYVTILTNKDQIATASGVMVGRVNENGSAAWDHNSLEGLNLKTVSTDAAGKVSISNVSGDQAGEMLMDRSIVRTSGESAARTIRELPYERVAKMHNYAKAKSKQEAYRISDTISQMMAANKTGDLKTSERLMGQLVSVMGYKNSVTGKMELKPETIAKASILDNYTEALAPILDVMESEFKDMNLNRIGDNKSLKAKKNIIFNNVLTNVLEDMSSSMPGDQTQLLSNSTAGVFTADELNKVDFLRSDLFPKVDAQMMMPSVANANSKYVSLDLSKDTGLLNMFYNNKFNDIDELKTGNAGFTALYDAYESIGSDERFHGVWGDLSRKDIMAFQKDRNLHELNHVMTTKLKDFVGTQRSMEGNSGFGLKFARNIQDYSDVSKLSGMVRSFSNDQIKDSVTKVMRSSNIDISMANGSDNKLINNIVDKYFMTFSKNDLEKQIGGLSGNTQNWMRAQYGFSRQEAMKTTQDLLNSVEHTNATLGIMGSGTDAKMFIEQGGRKQILDMHQYVLNNGVINHRINDINYATNFSYNVNKIVSKNGRANTSLSSHDVMDNIRITSNVQEALERTRSYSSSVSDAVTRGDNILDAIAYRTKSNNGLLREVGAMKQNDNFANTIKRSMYINTNPIIGVLPELRDAGLITRLEKEYHVGADSSKKFNSLIDKIKKGTIRPHEINSLLANEQNLYFQQYINPLLGMINSSAELGDVDGIDLKGLASSINPHIQDIKLAAGVLSVDDQAYAHGIAKFDKTARSVSIQTENQILYERNILKHEAKLLKEKGLDVAVGGKLMTSTGDKYLNHNGKYTSGLTMKYLQIDSNSLKNLFVDDVEKIGRGESNRFSKFLGSKYGNAIDVKEASRVLADKVMSLSTYQQQSIMDARVHYAAFHKNNEQLINSKKQFVIAHTENVEVINSMKKAHNLGFKIDKNGNVKYQLGYEVDKNQVLGMFGSEGNIERAKYNGVFRGRLFDKDGHIISESELSNFVKVNKLIGQNEDIIRGAINKEYNLKYQVIKKFEDFGHKVANDASEKSTVDAMDIAFGTVDKGLTETLDGYGFKNLRGRYLSKDYIENYLTPSLKLQGADVNSIVGRMLDERFSLSDALQEMFPQFKGVSQITSLESSKHESISMATTNIVESILRDNDLAVDSKKHFGSIFKGKLAYGKDGTIITDGITGINTKVKDSRLQKILDNTNYVLDDAGNTIGHTGYSHVTQLHDWEGGTYASNLDATQLNKDRFNVEKEINKLQSSTNLSGKEQTRLTSLLDEQANIERQLGVIGSQKGITFDKRANLNLNKSVWNNDSMSLTQENFKDKAEFEKYFSHTLNAKGKVSEEFLGNSVLDPVTSSLRNRTLMGFGETQLSSLSGKDKKKYGYLLDSYEKISDKISVEKAEKLYSFQQGVRAIDFNSKDFSKTKFNALTKGSEHGYNNFKEVDLSKLRPNEKGWLDLDIGGQGNTVTRAANNPYTQNLMIKTGLGGEHDYLAIARMPERHFEDNLIKTSHIKKLNQLQTILKEINSGNLNNEDLVSKNDYAKKLIGDIKTSQIYDTTSKYGLAGDLNASRLSQSFFGKASSITYNYEKAFGEDSYDTLKKLNGHNFLDKAQFDGKSLLQHYSEGKAIDAVAFSEEAAEDMGYFSKGMMKSAGVNTREEMINKLSTKGDTFLTTRFPRNQEASDKVTMGYLDTSLRGNQLKAVGHTGASMKMDHDGDEFGIGRLTNDDGHSFLTMADNSTDKFITSQKSMLMERAVNDNRYWDETIRDRVANVEGKIARSGSSIQDVAKKRIIDNHVYSAIMNSSDSNKYEATLNDKFYKGLVDNAVSFKGDGDAHADNLNAITDKFKGDQSKIQASKEKYVNAYRYQLYKDEFIAKSAKNSIGESNVTNLKIKEVYMGTADKAAKDYNYKSSLISNMMYLTEEAAISSKSSIKGLDPDRAKVWNTHAKDLVLGRGDAKDHISAMKDWTKKYAIDDLDYNFYWNKSNTFRDIAAQELNNGKSLTKNAFDGLVSNGENKLKLQSRLTNDLVDTLASLRNVKNVKEFFNYASVGQSTSGVKGAITKPTILSNSENVTDMMFKAQESSHSDLNSLMNFLQVSDTAKSTHVGGPNIVDRVVSSSEEVSEKSSLGRVIAEGAHDLFKGVTGSKIAMGAVGIAAGVMMLGYIGGRPKPADTQAMEEASNNDYKEQQSGGLMDQGMMPSSMGGQSGYVVNINARSDKGRNHAISAIQQAISNGTSSSVNIAMNINDNYGNISDRDIQKAIKDAL